MSLPTADRAGKGMHVVDGVLIVPAPADFSDLAFLELKRGVLASVHAWAVRGVVMDMSRLELLDTILFDVLADTARTVGLLGARTVFVGFQPGVVSALIDMDAPCDDIVSARTLEDGLELLRRSACAEPADAPLEELAASGDGEGDRDDAAGAPR